MARPTVIQSLVLFSLQVQSDMHLSLEAPVCAITSRDKNKYSELVDMFLDLVYCPVATR